MIPSLTLSSHRAKPLHAHAHVPDPDPDYDPVALQAQELALLSSPIVASVVVSFSGVSQFFLLYLMCSYQFYSTCRKVSWKAGILRMTSLQNLVVKSQRHSCFHWGKPTMRDWYYLLDDLLTACCFGIFY